MSEHEEAIPAERSGARSHRGGVCPDVDEVVRSLIQRLRTRRGEIAAAVGGNALLIEVRIEPDVAGPYRIGFASEGFVTTLSASNPLTFGYSPDVTIRGTAALVKELLTTEEPMIEAVHVAEPGAWTRYARVQRIVASELRAML